jgi:predicted metal-dependent hydrolase
MNFTGQKDAETVDALKDIIDSFIKKEGYHHKAGQTLSKSALIRF